MPSHPNACARQNISMAFYEERWYQARATAYGTDPATHVYRRPIQRAVLSVGLLGERVPQARVHVSHHHARRIQILEEQEDEHELIEDIDPQHRAPERRMRPDEGPIAKLDHCTLGIRRLSARARRRGVLEKTRKDAIAAYTPL